MAFNDFRDAARYIDPNLNVLTGKSEKPVGPGIGDNLVNSPLTSGIKWGLKNVAKAVATPVAIANDVGARALNVGNWALGGDPSYFNSNATATMLTEQPQSPTPTSTPGTPSLKLLEAHKPGEVPPVAPPAADNPDYYNQGRGGSAADALKEVGGGYKEYAVGSGRPPGTGTGYIELPDGSRATIDENGISRNAKWHRMAPGRPAFEPLQKRTSEEQAALDKANAESAAQADAEFDRRKGIFEAGGEAQYAIKQRLGYVPADYLDNRAAYDAAMLKGSSENVAGDYSLRRQALINQGLTDSAATAASETKSTKLEEERIKQAGLLERQKEVSRGLRWAADAKNRDKETEEQKLMAAAEVAQAVDNAKITGKSISDALARGREGQVIEEQGGAVWPFGNRSKKIWTEAPGKKIIATRVVNGVKQVKYADGTIR